MANVASPFGAVQQGTVIGATPNFMQTASRTQSFRIASGNATAIGFGDLVTLVAGAAPTGYIQRWTAGAGSATVQVAGVFYGCEYLSTGQKKWVWNNWWPGSDATGDVTAYVCADPGALFMIQAGATPVDQTYIGLTADVVMGTVSTTTGWSGMSLATPSATSPSTLPFKVVGPVTAPPGVNGTDVTTGFNNVLVTFNNQIFKSLLTIHS
jgi:hypothetical protein